ncbi:putative oxidoreductase GLYR1 homolog [Vespa mandarinia]|nr:putative oxidoreductase GLYR1 homolog [Vespa mandarinia]XP_046816943.1 putative oxidoreductase GLYR1 homolog [Vespa crabro]XP_047351276.1 putative oxidoreductase GLYR1 homolog isoform X1 [Vespa velutina]XP_050849643.1 cytokine-like nuclear factor N-PAC isoform X1 [Vespula vulgaris]
MSEMYKLGDLVWAKMKGFSPWPGRVSIPSKDLKKPGNTKRGPVQCIFFFGTNNYAWIEESNIKPYQQYKDTLVKSSKSIAFKDAVEAIEEFIAKGEVFEDGLDPDSLFDRLKEDTLSTEKKIVTKIPKPRKETPKAKRLDSGASDTRRPAKKQRRESSTSNSNRVGSISPALNHSTPTRKSGSTLLNRPANITRPVTPPLDVETLSQTLKEKNILPSNLKFGFLGLGIMGSGIVKNLINSGHSVIVWNRTQEKCADFVKAGAEQGLTPSDVVLAADITFSCVADPQAAKDMVFGNCGVLMEISSDKGYVEMTGIDAETSQDIAEAINAKGGRYLEAQVQGSKTQAQEGTLVILAAGDRTLFDDCQSCFEAMGKNSFYLGEVGNASKMNLVLQLMAGVTLAGLAESMALADRAGLQQKDVLEVLELTSLACPAILDKGKAIIEGGFPTQLPLQHMQKDLRLSLGMSDQLEQPLPLAAAANEVYKHAKRLGYGEHDASAVYIRARF